MEKLPWFLNALPSGDCSKGGNGAYNTNVQLKGGYTLRTFIVIYVFQKVERYIFGSIYLYKPYLLLPLRHQDMRMGSSKHQHFVHFTHPLTNKYSIIQLWILYSDVFSPSFLWFLQLILISSFRSILLIQWGQHETSAQGFLIPWRYLVEYHISKIQLVMLYWFLILDIDLVFKSFVSSLSSFSIFSSFI